MQWISRNERMPDEKGKYLAASSFGIGTAWYDPEWSKKFQDCDSNCDEGMQDFDGNTYLVTHWQLLPEPPTE